MLFTCKWVMVEYNTLIVKMWEDHIESEILQGPIQQLHHCKSLTFLEPNQWGLPYP